MRKTKLRVNLLLGFLLGVFLTQPVRAIPVTVVADTSPTAIKGLIESTKQTLHQIQITASTEGSRIAQAAEYVKQAQRWLDTVNHYTNVIIQDVKRFTTLKGIMGVVEKQLGLDDDTLKALSDIGQVVRGVFTLKNSFQALITTRLRMLKNIEERARNGIFDPGADLADLEDYLQNSIGRSAQDVIANRERLARFDNELERWTFELGQLRATKAALMKQRQETKAHLDRELQNQVGLRDTGAAESGGSTTTYNGRTSVAASAVESDKQTLLEIDGQLVQLDKQISELLEKITKRYKEYHQKFDESRITAEGWLKAQQGWDDFMSIREEAIERAIDQYGRPVAEPTPQ